MQIIGLRLEEKNHLPTPHYIFLAKHNQSKYTITMISYERGGWVGKLGKVGSLNVETATIFPEATHIPIQDIEIPFLKEGHDYTEVNNSVFTFKDKDECICGVNMDLFQKV